MAATGKAAKAGAGAYAAGKAARENAYVQRLIEDEELRHNLRDAFVSARHAYERMANGKHPTRALMDDKKVQRDLRHAASSLSEAADSLRGAKRRRKGGWLKRFFVIGLVGAGVAFVASEGVRKKVLDSLFGAEEEFEYTSTTTPPPAAEKPAEPAEKT